MFRTKAIIATVAARPLAALYQNPPEVDLFLARAEELEIDPAEEFVMVEDRGGLYEAHRHTLLALQRMTEEPFPLSEHLVDAEPESATPQYVEENRVLDLTTVLLDDKKQKSHPKVDVLSDWPDAPASDMDESQISALYRILTKSLAIIQGPPGTGKTYVSVQAIKIILANRKSDDPPILIACQTNHAVDQILRHIAEFERNFIRLGSRSKDRDKIRARTLFAIRQEKPNVKVTGSVSAGIWKKMKNIEKEMELLLAPLAPDNKPTLDLQALINRKILTEDQVKSLVDGASQWVQDDSGPNASSPFAVWLGKALVSVPVKQVAEDFGFDFEEADLEFEQLKEIEAENVEKDDEEQEALPGRFFPIADNWTCRKPAGLTQAKIKEALKSKGLWKIPEPIRPGVYRYLQTELKKSILESLREKTKKLDELARLRRIGNFERDEVYLRDAKVIGMTTTGLSKYRGLLAALKPKIVLIEEAGETLEAPVTVACLPTLQHLILVGDHQQLRPHCSVPDLETTYHLNVSLFERLINNKVEYDVLKKQRRMIPEIRRLLQPIYGNMIRDHECVLSGRPDIPGMGGINSFFFSHSWPEQRDELMSCHNPQEADMVAAFVEYLHFNGMPLQDITVLTFYNGQRKQIIKRLRGRPSLLGGKFNVVTVDSYQGEENEVVLLSLVRNNQMGQVGFLDVVNRVCVALSRAHCGFYIFGNASMLYNRKIPEEQKSEGKKKKKSKGSKQDTNTWKAVIQIMANGGEVVEDRLPGDPNRPNDMEVTIRSGPALPVRCTKHNNKNEVTDAIGLESLHGGCGTEPCGGTLDCGHPCEKMCHPCSHDMIECPYPCERQLPCGHPCSLSCGEAECVCKACSKKRAVPKADAASSPQGKPNGKGKSTGTAAWNNFAETEPVRYAAAIATPPARLIDIDDETADIGDLMDFSEDLAESMQQLALIPDNGSAESQNSSSNEEVTERSVGNGEFVEGEEMLSMGDVVSRSSDEGTRNEPSLLD